MNVTEGLRNDHELLRRRLARLEQWLPAAYAAPALIRNQVWLLALRAEEHLAREETLIEALRDKLAPETRREVAWRLAEHQDHWQTLQTLKGLIERNGAGAADHMDQIVAYTAHLTDGLREHMAEEERRLFVMMDRAARHGAEAARPASAESAGAIEASPAMSPPG